MKKICIVGGGASGMACAVLLARGGAEVTVLERGDRMGRKLSATGNGRGNVTNVSVSPLHYFTDAPETLRGVLGAFGWEDAVAFLESMGGIFLPDGRGRVYPAGKQASAVTDLLRFELEKRRVRTVLGAAVTKIEKKKRFLLRHEKGTEEADAVVLAAGGKAAPEFGTDGSAYALAKAFGHTVTPLFPVLVPLRCDTVCVKQLKGIRVDAALRVFRGGRERFGCRGDVLFTDSGLSGDAVFRASSYTEVGDVLEIDFLPDVPEERLSRALAAGEGERALLCIVQNGLGRTLFRAAEGEEGRLRTLLKHFRTTVTGDLGFARAQVTRGGVPLGEVNAALMSKKTEGLFFAGEVLNVDGECGGYNLHWAFASAHAAARGILC